MAVDRGLFIVEVGQGRCRVVDTFASSLRCDPPPPVPLRLFRNSDTSYHIVTVSLFIYVWGKPCAFISCDITECVCLYMYGVSHVF